MKKINLLALVVLFSVNVFTPINYVGADTSGQGDDAGLYTLNINYDADGESVAPYTIDLSEGSPYCVISPSVDGYTPDRIEVSGTMGSENMTENVTYALNGHSLTITYKYTDGTEAVSGYTKEYKYGSSYNVKSPIIAGYTADKPVVSGIMGSEDITEDVTYAINSYTLTIIYRYQNGGEAASGYTHEYEYRSNYSVQSPTIEGYVASNKVVNGVMPDRDTVYVVNYTPLPSGGTIDVDDPGVPLGILSSPTILSNSPTLSQNLFNPDSPSVTVFYVNLNGEKMYSDYVYIPSEREIYTIESPESDYYHADKPIIKGMMCGNDTVYTVTYRPNNDENGNGIADEEETYTVTFDLNGGKVESGVETTVKVLSGNKVQAITPTKNGYTLKGWTLNGVNFDFSTPITSNITPVAQWKSIGGGSSGGGGGSGRGGGSSTSVKDDEPKDVSDNSKSDENKNDSNENTHNSSENTNNSNENKDNLDENQVEHSDENKDVVPAGVTPERNANKNSNSNDNNIAYTQEFVDAYGFAKESGITTTSSIEDAKMYGNLTRIQMAKMLSQFSINVLGKEPDTTLNNKFNDVSEDLDKQYDDGVTLSFQLGIMGQNMPNNKFRPNDEVSRAEFVAAFSRMLYGTSDGEYRSTRNYYKPHMSKLYNEGIVSDTNPNMKERRGYVMIMLMRSAM